MATCELLMETCTETALMRVACVTESLAERCPATGIRVKDAMCESSYDFGVAAVQVSLDIDVLDELLGRVCLDGLPCMPERAVRRRQLSFLAGRLCAEHALRTSGHDLAGPIGQGESGEPQWPEGWTGSISHTRRIALSIVSPRTGRFGIGIDAEEVLDGQTLHDVLQVCANKAERHLITGGPDRARLAATVMFCAKEAYYKAIHGRVQRFVDFDEMSLSELDLRSGIFCLQPTARSHCPNDLPSARGRFVIEGNVVLACIAAENISHSPSVSVRSQ
jgi:enterobactin synthetase component D